MDNKLKGGSGAIIKFKIFINEVRENMSDDSMFGSNKSILIIPSENKCNSYCEWPKY